MGVHPTYLEAFKATHDAILSQDGPLSIVDRHHIALMVSQNKQLTRHFECLMTFSSAKIQQVLEKKPDYFYYCSERQKNC